MSAEPISAINRAIGFAVENGAPPAAIDMAQDVFDKIKLAVPRREYRKRVGTRFINAYRDVPINIVADAPPGAWVVRGHHDTAPELAKAS
jgi:hypothetical protein